MSQQFVQCITINHILFISGNYSIEFPTFFFDKTTKFSSTGNDEMCNFYMMYWVEGDKLLEENTCNSAGPPNYYFAYDRVCQ